MGDKDMVRVSSKAKVEAQKPLTGSRSSHPKASGVCKDSHRLQIVVDHKVFNIRVSEDLLGANIFNHKAFYNGVEHRDSSGRSVREKGMPVSPSLPSVRTHDRDGKDQECSSAPISSNHRQPTVALNGTATRLDATDREGDILSGPGLRGIGLGGAGTVLGQLGCLGSAGMLQETWDLGIGEGVGLCIGPSQHHQGSGKKEGLGLDVGPFQLQSEKRKGSGNTGSQQTEGVERGNKPCLSQQPSPKGSGDSRRDRDLSSFDGSPSRGTPRKRKKTSQKNRKKRKTRLRIAARSSPMQAEDHPLNVQGEITLSGNNISDGCIKNMNRVFLCNSQLDEAIEVWQRGKELGAEHRGDE
ncbi:hypothetical protein Ancab_015596 [Ancistrocladus abbreviatus]